MATQGLQYDQNQANIDATLTQDQLAARSQVPGAITLDQMKPVAPITLPTLPPPSVNPDSVVGGVQAGQKTLQDYISAATPQTTEADRQNQSILDQIAQLTGQSVGKDQALAQAQQQAGAPELLKQQSELAGQIAIANSAYSQLGVQEQNALTNAEVNGVGVTSGVVAGQQGAIQRQFASQKALKAAEIGMLAARQQAVSGNLQTALTIAQNAINTKYAPIEDELKIKQAQLQALQPTLNKQEKIQALALERQYQDQQQQIADEKATAKDAVKFGLENNVNTPFFTRAGTVYNTNTGKAYSTPEEFFADGGARDFSNAPVVNLQAKPTEVSPGNTLVDPTTGRVIYQAPARATSGGGSTSSGNLSDVQQIAQAIVNGNQPPVLTGLYGKSAAVRAELERQGYNLTAATQDYTATQKYIATLNGAQQTRLRQAVNFTSESLGLLDELNGTAESALSRSGITNFAKVQKTAALQGLYGQEVKSAFTQLDNQIGDLVSELATVYKGGNSSTDESLKQAAKQLSTNWDYQTLKDNINLVRRNLQIRINSINNTDVAGIGDNQYNPNPQNNSNDPLGIK